MFFIALLAPLVFGFTDQYIQRHASKTRHHYKNIFTPADSKGFYYRHVVEMESESGKWSKVVFYDSIPAFKK